MLYQERYSSAYLSQAQSSLVQWGLDGKLRTILDTISLLRALKYSTIIFSSSGVTTLNLFWVERGLGYYGWYRVIMKRPREG